MSDSKIAMEIRKWEEIGSLQRRQPFSWVFFKASQTQAREPGPGAAWGLWRQLRKQGPRVQVTETP